MTSPNRLSTKNIVRSGRNTGPVVGFYLEIEYHRVELGGCRWHETPVMVTLSTARPDSAESGIRPTNRHSIS